MNKLTKITKRQDIAVVSSRVLAEQLKHVLYGLIEWDMKLIKMATG